MKHRAISWMVAALLLTLLPASLTGARDVREVRADFEDAASIGKWDGFYRGHQLQGHLTSLRQGLVTIPEYMFETSFPYRKRPYEEEIPFVDTISIVRFCGGYQKAWARQSGFDEPAKLDLAYEDENGELQYRFEWVKKRLNPYLEMGYRDIIISLDNVPYAMQAYESTGAYGQIAPPRDYEEWGRFIEALCNHMIDLYGYDLPNRWTFRMGTENNGQKPGDAHTFDGTHEQWIRWYDFTSAAVKKVLPGARFGPGEFGGPIHTRGVEPPAVDYIRFVEHCATGANYATGEIGAPLDFIANSSHSVPRYQNGKLVGCAWPSERVDANRDSYRNMIGPHRQYADLPKYCFQFGHLCSEQTDPTEKAMPGVGSVLRTCEPGGRGAAWTFHTLVEMKEEVPAIEGIWHWGVLESFKGGLDGSAEKSTGRVTHALLKSNGWLYSILDYAQGGEAWVFDVPAGADGTVYKILFTTRRGHTYLIASAFHADRGYFTPRELSVTIPARLFPGNPKKTLAGQVELTQKNSVYREIRKDFEERGLLAPGHARYDDLLAGIYEISDREKRGEVIDCLRANFPVYRERMVDSLTLKPFEGVLERGNDEYTFTFEMIPGSVKAIAIEHP
ncbi:GH39 family glycosyl hydrolase [Kiritimatiella glycovorans]|uniref:Beta-xylosidase n=1 Tax=Kiritimatiella glycovorans TaxID=1307763 RepID=A0A0G3EDU9_9BACT|nr:hypothetical protein [Kiritimatiella glycovorans]AKJ64483.1 Beta-xylosidase [Kiritimatiella glycovorans]